MVYVIVRMLFHNIILRIAGKFFFVCFVLIHNFVINLYGSVYTYFYEKTKSSKLR